MAIKGTLTPAILPSLGAQTPEKTHTRVSDRILQYYIVFEQTLDEI